jgi:YHS domain-containing protein
MMPELDCATCTEAQKIERGCYAVQLEDGKWERGSIIPTQIDGKDYYFCPRRIVNESKDLLFDVLEAYAHYKNGFLPDPGSINEQPHRLMKLVLLVAKVIAECEEQQRQEAVKKTKHNG